MKIPSCRGSGECGAVAVVVMVTILALLVLYSAANVRTLVHLQGELKLLEQRHAQHWAQWPAAAGSEASAVGSGVPVGSGR